MNDNIFILKIIHQYTRKMIDHLIYEDDNKVNAGGFWAVKSGQNPGGRLAGSQGSSSIRSS